ncbi:MAG TPA: prepilin peptidase [Aestuariivirgaceae bacterium]|nr:prepilin peptidase [Aestuariivirgaceae bacterium]
MTARIVLILFILLMLTAAVSDLRSYRLPNWLVAAVASLFIVAAAATGMPLSLALWHGLAGVLVLIAGFGLFTAGVIGGGDAKLLAAVALWIGWTKLATFIFYTALAGGALAIVMLIWEFFRLHVELTAGNPNSSLIKRITSLKPDLPYGVAIAAGACATLPETWWAAS